MIRLLWAISESLFLWSLLRPRCRIVALLPHADLQYGVCRLFIGLVVAETATP